MFRDELHATKISKHPRAAILTHELSDAGKRAVAKNKARARLVIEGDEGGHAALFGDITLGKAIMRLRFYFRHHRQQTVKIRQIGLRGPLLETIDSMSDFEAIDDGRRHGADARLRKKLVRGVFCSLKL